MNIKNISYACLTSHCEDNFGEKENFIWINSDMSEQHFSIEHFEFQSNKIANILHNNGIKLGDVVSIFLPRNPILISAFFSILKLQAISCILSSTLGEESLFDRLKNNGTKLIITKHSLSKKILTIWEKLPQLEKILLIDEQQHQTKRILSLKQSLISASGSFSYPYFVEANTPAFLQYTSGSTGKPKGVLHVHGALEDMISSFYEIFQIQTDDNYWCTADPAWVTGLVYGIIAPFASNTNQIHFGGGYKAKSWIKILDSQKINIWYTTPTALRMLMQENPDLFLSYDFNYINRIYSVGEPLNPEVYNWFKGYFNKDVYDTWWQSETGSILIANRPGLSIKPGSMGMPRKGIYANIYDKKMKPVPIGRHGHLCIEKGWKSMFRTYYNNIDAYQEKFHGQIYITGDLAKMDSDGYFWYVSRADDVITTGGHLIGPFEVESTLLEIDEIIDVAVIGASDPLLHQKIVAFVVLNSNLQWSKELELKCRLYISKKISTIAIPAEFRRINRLPKNQSGKILRRVLKSLYEGEKSDDLSTMEKK